MKVILFGGAILMLFTTVQAALPMILWFLPLGGSAIAQVGIVFGTAVALSTLIDIWGKRNEEN